MPNNESAVQIARDIEQRIERGSLVAGERLPPVRRLAAELGVSPTTVSAAFARLKSRGLVITQGRRGTRVSHRPPVAVPGPAPYPDHVQNLSDGNPDPSLLPNLGPVLAKLDARHHMYGEPPCHNGLLRLARRSLTTSEIDAEHITVTGGALDGIDLVLHAHLRPGDRVGVEDPAFPGVLHLLAARGLAPVPIQCDDEGPVPDACERALREGLQAIIVTPRAQNPTGAALSSDRARRLTTLLRRHRGVLLIEDDHAASIAGVPARSLTGARPGHWAVVRSVCKTYGPDLRLALLAGDELTVARVEGRRLVSNGWVSFLLQRLVADLWRDPEVRAAVRTATRTYAARRRALVAALDARGIASHGASGLNVWVPVPEEAAAVQALERAGFGVLAGARFRLQSDPAIRITTARIEPEVADQVAEALARSLGSARSGRTQGR